jgi:hypothetical protein
MLHLILFLLSNTLVMGGLITVTRVLLLWRNNVAVIAFMLCFAQLTGIFFAVILLN